MPRFTPKHPISMEIPRILEKASRGQGLTGGETSLLYQQMIHDARNQSQTPPFEDLPSTALATIPSTSNPTFFKAVNNNELALSTTDKVVSVPASIPIAPTDTHSVVFNTTGFSGMSCTLWTAAQVTRVCNYTKYHIFARFIYHNGSASHHVNYLLRQAAISVYGRMSGLDEFLRYVGQQLPSWFRTFRKRLQRLLEELRQPHPDLPNSVLIKPHSPTPKVWKAYTTLFPKEASDSNALPSYIGWLNLVLKVDPTPSEEGSCFQALPAIIQQAQWQPPESCRIPGATLV